MQVAQPRNQYRSVSYSDSLAILIGLAIGGGIVFSLLTPPKVALSRIEKGFRDYYLQLKTLQEQSQSQSNQTPVRPTQPGSGQWQLPQVNLPQFSLDNLKLPGISQPRTRLEWIVQPPGVECPTHEYGNHWSGATGRNHCLVRKEY